MNDKLYLIFDMDGVIVDNHDYHKKAWNQFCERHGFKLKKEEFATHINGRSVTEVVAWLFGDETPADEIWKYSMEKEEIYRNLFRPDIQPVEGLKGFLARCKEQGIPTAVATSAPPVNMDFTLNALDLKQYFQVFKDGSGVKKAKPDPEIYLQAAAELQAPPERCVVFEDSLSGIEAAKEANMKVVALTTTHTAGELKSSNPALIIKNFSQLETKQLLNLVIPETNE